MRAIKSCIPLHTDSPEGNLIRSNGGTGVVAYGGGALAEARNNSIRRNCIYYNTGLGLDYGGVYLYRMAAGSFNKTRVMMLVR